MFGASIKYQLAGTPRESPDCAEMYEKAWRTQRLLWFGGEELREIPWESRSGSINMGRMAIP